MDKIHNNLYSILAAELAIPAFAKAVKGENITRREFIHGVTIALAPLFASREISHVSSQVLETAIIEQDYSGIIPRISSYFDNFKIPDLADRTGIEIAKHSRARELGFFDSLGIGREEDLSIWGTGHLYTQDQISRIREVANNPREFGLKLAKREIAYLIGIGTNISDVIVQAGLLIRQMAGFIPVMIKGKGTEFTFTSFPQKENVFFDDRLLAIDPQKMSYSQIVKKSEEKASNLYWQVENEIQQLSA